MHRFVALAPLLPSLTLWVALTALASLVIREVGLSRLKRYWCTLVVLGISLLAIPAGGLFRVTKPYHRRMLAVVFRERSPSIKTSGCALFLANNIWNRAVNDVPVDPASAGYVANMEPDAPLHPDFGPASGIPFTVATGSEPVTEVTLGGGAAESDPGPYRIPSGSTVEPGDDSHVLVLNAGECVIYEFYHGKQQGLRQWSADSAAIFPLQSNLLRPKGWTSADAAGLPILPGLVRYEEVAAGRITHALRFTTRRTRRAFTWPATHFASQSNDPRLPPMGQRFRLRRSFNVDGFSPEARVILTAMKTYGIILADNGGSWFLSGSPDSRWSQHLLAELTTVHGSDFEAVDVSGLIIQLDSAEARQ